MRNINNKKLKYVFLIIATISWSLFYINTQEIFSGTAYQVVKPGNLLNKDKKIISDNLYETAKFENEFLRNIFTTATMIVSNNEYTEEDINWAKDVLKNVTQTKLFIENKSKNKIYTNMKSKNMNEFKSKEKDYCNIELDFVEDNTFYAKTIDNNKKSIHTYEGIFKGLTYDDVKINMTFPKKPIENNKDKSFYDDELVNYYNDFVYYKDKIDKLILVSVTTFLVAVISSILCLTNKGRLFKSEKSLYNKIPLELNLLIIFIMGYYSNLKFSYIPSLTIKTVFVLTILVFIENFIGLTNKKDIFVNSLIKKIFKILNKFFFSILKYRKSTPLITTLIIMGVVSIVIIGLSMMYLHKTWYWGNQLLGYIVYVSVPSILIVIIVVYVIKKLIYLNKIMEGTQEIKNGKIDYKIEIQGNDSFTILAENINNISEGLDNAIDEKLKSERMKSELITNVSHDLKTPLTAIINYVGLIKKEEDIQPPYLNDYVNILDNKSKRLKVLIEDLFEASKASSGTINLNIEKLNLSQLLKQSIGENEEKLAKSNLELIIDLPKDPVYINCDGKRMYRVFENLLTNIAKYSLENTRVYIQIKEKGDNVYVDMKNISSYQLNFEPDEITERFKRGDLSRNTEGSGLGLAIAKDLVELQKGKFEIQIDADLFKVELVFIKAQ
ncbi:sensor histidine kinase [Romboutsia sedimentorum]|uniref:HAMP domain-containing sensor histidine kinase n=1 Tax=Romboutsia sedimentorum TaxID=1368474 RepID=UPI0024DEA7C8|nr:sensor histidine kinase [Romboutsia sedimentorum]MDK2586848.1 sensor histidine kinase [Romboutsia sedimentorum]